MAERGPVSAGTGAGLEPRLGGLVGSGLASALLAFFPPLTIASPLPLAVNRLQSGPVSAWLAAVLAAALIAAVSAPIVGFGYLAILALPGVLLGEALARGRGMLRGCGWAFLALSGFITIWFATSPTGVGPSVLGFYDKSNAQFLAQLQQQGGVSADDLAQWQDLVKESRELVATVYPALLVILAAIVVVANAALLRLYLLRRDPGWLEDGEFERVRFPLPLVLAFVLAGGAVAVPLLRPAGYNVLLVVAFFFALQGLAVVGFYARRLAAPPLVRGLALVLVLANPWAPQLLALLGLFDNWFDFRKWAEPPVGRGADSGPEA